MAGRTLRIVECQRCGFLREMPVLRGQHTKVLCEPCARTRMLAVKARYREKHREKLRQESREYQATRRAAEPEYAERDRERIRRLGRENPEYLSAIRRRSYAKHAEKRRRESSEQKLIRRQAIWERDGRLCHLCLHPVEWCDLEIDHVIPRSRGGGNEPTNLAASHRACNRRKAARLEMTSG